MTRKCRIYVGTQDSLNGLADIRVQRNDFIADFNLVRDSIGTISISHPYIDFDSDRVRVDCVCNQMGKSAKFDRNSVKLLTYDTLTESANDDSFSGYGGFIDITSEI